MESNAVQNANKAWGQAQLIDSKGNPLPRSDGQNPPLNKGGGGGFSGGEIVTDIAGLKKNVGFLNWIAAAGVAALIALYLLLSSQIGDRYDRTSDKLDEISSQISDMRVEISEVKSNGNAQGRD